MPVNDWIAAGKAGAAALSNAHGVIRDASPKYGKTYETAMIAKTSEEIAQLRAKERITTAKISEQIADRKQESAIKAMNKEIDRTTGGIRKAGYLAALGGVAGGVVGGIMENREEARQEKRDAEEDARELARIKKLAELLNNNSSSAVAEPKLLDVPEFVPGTPPAIVTDGGSGESSSVSTGGGDVARQEVYSYLTDHHKLSRNQALGIMANIDRESGFRIAPPGGDGGNSFGMLQWNNTYGRSDLMMQHVPDWKTNWKGQLDHALSQNQLPEYSDYITQFRNTEFNSPQAAADAFMNNWEKPADRIGGSRKHAGFLSTYNF